LSGAEIKIFPGTKRPVLAQQLALNIFLFEEMLLPSMDFFPQPTKILWIL